MLSFAQCTAQLSFGRAFIDPGRIDAPRSLQETGHAIPTR